MNENNQMTIFEDANLKEVALNEFQVNNLESVFKDIESLDLESKVNAINEIKVMLHKISPFKEEPVDLVLWVKNEMVGANDYNPNSVAPPEMELLEHSIYTDGYTQPIVSWEKEDSDNYEVVDGFHRSRVGKESKLVRERVNGYVPLTIIKDSQLGRNDRIASTIRHNRARGKHKVDSMSEIVIELKRRNWSDKKVAKELGMDQDEVLRLTQIQGLAEMFKNEEFTQAWEVDHTQYEEEVEVIQDEEEN